MTRKYGQLVKGTFGTVLLRNVVDVIQKARIFHGQHVNRGHLRREHRFELVFGSMLFIAHIMKLSACSSALLPWEPALPSCDRMPVMKSGSVIPSAFINRT